MARPIEFPCATIHSGAVAAARRKRRALADASTAVSGVGSDDDTSRRLDARHHDADLEELVTLLVDHACCASELQCRVLVAGAATDDRL
jgi:hypothetical protein